VSEGLRAGGSSHSSSTKAHRDRLESSLAECGIDLTAVAATGQYIALDAAETLRQFMVDSSPEAWSLSEFRWTRN